MNLASLKKLGAPVLASVLLAGSACVAAESSEPAPVEPECTQSKKTHAALAPTLTWIPDSDPKAALLCVHGLGLYNGAYRKFGENMTKLGVATYAVDVHGFGSWLNMGGQEPVDFADCEDAVFRSLKLIHRAQPGVPVFLLGESMGGAIALHAAAAHPELIDGLISCVPSGERFRAKRTEFKVALHFLRGADKEFDVGSGVIAQASETRNEKGEVNEQLQEAWTKDKLARLKLSPKELWQFQQYMNENHDKARLLTDKPVLVVQGDEDNLVKWEGTLELWRELGTSDKQFELIPNARHLIFEESQYNDPALNDRVLTMVNHWLDDHISKHAKPIREASAKDLDRSIEENHK